MIQVTEIHEPNQAKVRMCICGSGNVLMLVMRSSGTRRLRMGVIRVYTGHVLLITSNDVKTSPMNAKCTKKELGI